MRSARRFYEQDAERRARWDGTDPIIQSRNRVVMELVPNGARCLDVGCGAGGLAPLLGRKARFIAGIDLSLSLAAAAAGRGMKTICADFDEGELPLADSAFDSVVCCDVLEHVFDPVAFVRRIVRVLRPGGVLVVSVPNIRYWPRVRSLIRGYFPRTTGDPNGYDGGHLHYFASRNVAEVFGLAGLELLHVTGFNADPSRRAWLVSVGLRLPGLRGVAREFGCSTVIVAGRRPLQGAS
jgi:methionine biosynthesis protein MetW